MGTLCYIQKKNYTFPIIKHSYLKKQLSVIGEKSSIYSHSSFSEK